MFVFEIQDRYAEQIKIPYNAATITPRYCIANSSLV